MEYVAEGGVVAALVEIWNAPCAMVPLNPNELSRELFDAVVRGTTSTGIWNGFDDTIDDRCAFSLRENTMIDNTCKNEKRTRAAVHLQQQQKPSAAPQ